MKTIRIFISSPGDVADERERARQVVEGLRRRYARHFYLKPVLWEDLPLQADMSFQKGIEMVLSKEHGIDISIFILWSRLGSPPGGSICRPDGRPYRSGTERELDLMLAARQQSDPRRPAMMVYTRRDEASFDEQLRGKATREKEEIIGQKKLVEQFIVEEFHDQDTGENVRAFHSFDRPVVFAQRLRVHLSELLDEMAGGAETEAVWDVEKQGSPFRGLEVFEPEHADIFFGREDEIIAIRHALREQARQGCAFVLLSGASGSGKSSLARAGVLPAIVENEIDESADNGEAVVASWRWLIVSPAELAPKPVEAFVRLLAGERILPELRGEDASLDDLANVMRRTPEDAFKLQIKPALARAARQAGGGLRILLVLDQMEGFFSSAAVSPQARAEFLGVIETLACSGAFWVIATARSDFNPQIQTEPALIRLKAGLGSVDVLPPTADGLRRLIEEPAALAGLQFEQRDGRALSDQILRDAAARAELLPLVEFVLHELFEQRTSENRLTFAAYKSLGGVSGALAKRADDEFRKLPKDAKGAFEFVMRQLTTLGSTGVEAPARRWARLSEVTSTPAAKRLVDAFVDARLFQAAQSQDGESIVGFAHEALLFHWPQLQRWTEENRAFLSARLQLDTELREWEKKHRKRNYLLSPGPHLKSARQLLRKHKRDLNSNERLFIRRSSRRARLRSGRGWVVVVSFTVLVLLLALAGMICGLLSLNGERPLAWVPVVMDYGQGIIYERFGRKEDALLAYKAGFTKSSRLKIPLALRMADVGAFDTILELTLATHAPLPDDEGFRLAVDWAEQYAQGQTIGESSDEGIIGVTETMGRLLRNRMRWDAAAKADDERLFWLRKKAQRKPQDAETKEKLISTLLTASRTKIDGKQFDSAEANLKEALSVVQKTPLAPGTKEETSEIEFRLGDVAAWKKDLSTAVSHYESSVQIDRTLLAQLPAQAKNRGQGLITSLTSLARAQNGLKDWSAADTSLTEAIKLSRANCSRSPDDKDVRQGLIKTLNTAAELLSARFTDQASLRKAVHYLTEVLAIDPDNTDVRSFRGYTYALLGQKAESVEDFRRALAAKPENLQSLRLFGWSYVILGDLTAALQPWAEFRRLSETTGKTPDVQSLTVFAAAEWIRGDQPQAINFYQQLVALDPTWKDADTIRNYELPEARKTLLETIRARAFPNRG